MSTWFKNNKFAENNNMQQLSFTLYSYTEQLNTIPIVITLVTKDKANEQLRFRVQQQLAALSEQININITLVEVDRFGISIFEVLM